MFTGRVWTINLIQIHSFCFECSWRIYLSMFESGLHAKWFIVYILNSSVINLWEKYDFWSLVFESLMAPVTAVNDGTNIRYECRYTKHYFATIALKNLPDDFEFNWSNILFEISRNKFLLAYKILNFWSYSFVMRNYMKFDSVDSNLLVWPCDGSNSTTWVSILVIYNEK